MGVLFETAATDEFERLYSSYASNVFRYALATLGHQADAEDVTQTTFMNAYRALRRGERPVKPENWLIAIARNACIERFRHNGRRPREVALEGELPVAAVQGDETPTAAEIQHAIQQLPSAQRAALVMRELEGRSYAETAAALRISSSALETLLVRARRTLREHLEGDISCGDAAAAITMQLEGRLPAGGRRALRAHLRSCGECATLARRLRAQTRTLRGLPAFSFPTWAGRFLAGGSGAGAPATGGIGATGLALKAAAVLAVGAAVGGGAYAGTTHLGRGGVHRMHRMPSSGVVGTPSRSEPRPAPSNSHPTQSAVRAHGAVARDGERTIPAVPAAGSTAAADAGPAAPAPSPSAGAATRGSADAPSGAPAVPVDTAQRTGGTGSVARGIGVSKPAAGHAAAQPATKSTLGQAKSTTNGNGNGNGTTADAAVPASKSPPGQAKSDVNAVNGAGATASPPPPAQVPATPSVSAAPDHANATGSGNANPSANSSTNGAPAHGRG